MNLFNMKLFLFLFLFLVMFHIEKLEKFLNSRSTTPTSKSSATALTQESSSAPTPLPNSGDNTEARNSKRKPIRKSPAWEHFTLAEKGDPNDPSGVCNYCGQDFACRTSTCRTSTMLKHLKRCTKTLLGFRIRSKNC